MYLKSSLYTDEPGQINQSVLLRHQCAKAPLATCLFVCLCTSCASARKFVKCSSSGTLVQFDGPTARLNRSTDTEAPRRQLSTPLT